jgi:hypothetical protein
MAEVLFLYGDLSLMNMNPSVSSRLQCYLWWDFWKQKVQLPAKLSFRKTMDKKYNSLNAKISNLKQSFWLTILMSWKTIPSYILKKGATLRQ